MVIFHSYVSLPEGSGKCYGTPEISWPSETPVGRHVRNVSWDTRNMMDFIVQIWGTLYRKHPYLMAQTSQFHRFPPDLHRFWHVEPHMVQASIRRISHQSSLGLYGSRSLQCWAIGSLNWQHWRSRAVDFQGGKAKLRTLTVSYFRYLLRWLVVWIETVFLWTSKWLASMVFSASSKMF